MTLRRTSVPTYQYACRNCDHTFEQVQSFSDEALTVCPRCEGSLRKIFNAVGVVFKGSGFYRTDTRADTKSGPTGSSGSTTSVSKGSDTTSSESSKSDTKAAAGSAA
jgi:putative FmdB family regulatory protein